MWQQICGEVAAFASASSVFIYLGHGVDIKQYRVLR